MSPSLSWLFFGGWLLAVIVITAFLMGGNEGTGR